MKYDGQSAYVLFACDAHKQRDSMRIIGIAGDIVTLYAIRLCNLINNPSYVHLEDTDTEPAIPVIAGYKDG